MSATGEVHVAATYALGHLLMRGVGKSEAAYLTPRVLQRCSAVSMDSEGGGGFSRGDGDVAVAATCAPGRLLMHGVRRARAEYLTPRVL